MMSDAEKFTSLAETVAEYSFINKQMRVRSDALHKELQNVTTENEELKKRINLQQEKLNYFESLQSAQASAVQSVKVAPSNPLGFPVPR